jgi:acyl carrier protein
MTTFERLQQIIEECVGADINDTQSPEQVGLDSLQTAELFRLIQLRTDHLDPTPER